MNRTKILLVLAALFAAGALLLPLLFWLTLEPRLDADTMPSRAAGPPAAAYAEAVEDGRRLARSRVAEENLPGLSVAVAVDGEVVWAEGFGWAEYETERPVTPETRFRIGDVTMAVNAAAAALLAERGRLDLDAPVGRYLPDLPEAVRAVTVRQLLAHTAGIRQYRGDRERLRRAPCASDGERLAIFAEDPPRFEPGAAWEHSVHGHVLAGAVVARAAGRSWLDFVQDEVLAPLGLRHTGADPGEAAGPDDAQVYFPRLALAPRYGLQTITGVDLSCVLPAAGLVSTPTDLVRFGSALLAGELLEPATVERLFAPVALASGEPTSAGLGWTVRRDRLGADRTPVRVVGQDGTVAGGAASLVLVPERNLAVAVATNLGWTSDSGFAEVMLGGASGMSAGPVSELSVRLAELFSGGTVRVEEPAEPS